MRVSGTPPIPAASFHVWIGCVRLGDRFNYYPPCRETRLGSPQYWGVSAIRDSFHIVIHASCHQVFIQYQINYENHGTILLEAICHNCTRLPVIWVYLFGSVVPTVARGRLLVRQVQVTVQEPEKNSPKVLIHLTQLHGSTVYTAQSTFHYSTNNRSL